VRILSAIAISIFVAFEPAVAQEFKGPPWFSADRCSRKDAIEADKDLDRLTSWAAVNRTFKRYRQCDDGGLAEGYSDAVAKLFANRWQTLRDFANLSQQNPEFERFVFWHIDTTVDLVDAHAIIANARNHCPADLRALCRRLEAEAKKPE
jgi:hypothetical protein